MSLKKIDGLLACLKRKPLAIVCALLVLVMGSASPVYAAELTPYNFDVTTKVVSTGDVVVVEAVESTSPGQYGAATYRMSVTVNAQYNLVGSAGHHKSVFGRSYFPINVTISDRDLAQANIVSVQYAGSEVASYYQGSSVQLYTASQSASGSSGERWNYGMYALIGFEDILLVGSIDVNFTLYFDVSVNFATAAYDYMLVDTLAPTITAAIGSGSTGQIFYVADDLYGDELGSLASRLQSIDEAIHALMNDGDSGLIDSAAGDVGSASDSFVSVEGALMDDASGALDRVDVDISLLDTYGQATTFWTSAVAAFSGSLGAFWMLLSFGLIIAFVAFILRLGGR